MRLTSRIAALVALSFFVLPAPAQQESPDSVLWTGTAVEHEGSVRQAFRLARLMLDKALQTPSWTAAIEQGGARFRSLPPAIIMDLDETVLDNTPFEARLAVGPAADSSALFDAWVNAAKVPPLPGAIEFTRYARSKGVTIFYVTNRTAAQKKATRANLELDGFPLDPKIDTLYCKDERPEWGSDKSTRRAAIAARYRILLLFGDDLRDFVPGAGASLDRRRELAAPYADWWGTKWIVLPNPMYGSWDTATYSGVTDPTLRKVMEAKAELLRKLAGPAITATAPTP